MAKVINLHTRKEINHLAQAGLSQRVIAHTLGVAQSTVSKYLHQPGPANMARVHLEIPNGTVIVASDAHYWPGQPTPAHLGLITMCHILNPSAVIMNGDVFDGARISRHASIGWECRPKLMEELAEVEARMGEIQLNTTAGTKLIWTLGNHDMRFETRLAAVAPEYEGITGFHLKDHFPNWTPAWSCWINNNTVVKHRFKGGTHAAYNNTVTSGMSIVTGHTHRLLSVPFNDYRGTRYGVESGTLAEPYGPQFIDYTEDAPANWQSGFVVLTYNNSILLTPEFVAVVGPNQVSFRGEIFNV